MAAKKRMSKDERRLQLMDAAAKLFARKSYGNVTTAEIASTAGVTEPVLYQHFKTKQDLYVALIRRARDVAFESYEKVAAPFPTPLLKLIAVVRAHGGVMREHDPYYRLHLRALATTDMPRVKQTLRENYVAYNEYFSALVRKAQDQGEVHKAVEAEQIAWFIMSQGMLMNLCNQLGITQLREEGYVDGLLRDALEHVTLIDDPIRVLSQILQGEAAG